MQIVGEGIRNNYSFSRGGQNTHAHTRTPDARAQTNANMNKRAHTCKHARTHRNACTHTLIHNETPFQTPPTRAHSRNVSQPKSSELNMSTKSHGINSVNMYPLRMPSVKESA